MKQIIFSKQAVYDLRSVPAETERRIIAKLKIYAENPAALANNIKAMQGGKYKGCLRLRVGYWRVIFSESGEVISIVRVGNRGDIYR